MRIVEKEMPFDIRGLEVAIDRLPVATMIPHPRMMPAPLDNEYARCRYTCAHLNYQLHRLVLAQLEWLCGVM